LRDNAAANQPHLRRLVFVILFDCLFTGWNQSPANLRNW